MLETEGAFCADSRGNMEKYGRGRGLSSATVFLIPVETVRRKRKDGSI